MATAIKTELETKGELSIGEKVEAGTFVLSLTVGGIRTKASVKGDKVGKMAAAIRVDAPETVEEMSDGADEIAVSKELLKVDEVLALMQEVRGTRALVRGKALPGVRYLKGGMYVYPFARVTWVERIIAAAQERIDGLCDSLERKWPEIMTEEERRLAPLGLFDLGDYPTIAKIRKATRLRFSWLRFSTPGDLKTISQEAFDAERAKAAAMWEETGQQVRLAQLETLNGFVGRLREALVPGEDGKRRVLQQRTLDGLEEWLGGFDFENVTDFDELRAARDRVRDAMRGVDAEVLRREPRAADRVGQTMTDVGEALSSLTVEQSRRVRLRD